MRFLYRGKDGGKDSTVWGFWLFEIKWLGSLVFLCFEHGTREAYHDHAFNAVSWLLSGNLIEKHRGSGLLTEYRPSLKPIVTRRSTFHKVRSYGRSWVVSFRGPWKPTWHEWLYEQDREVTLTHGRKEVA